MAGNNGGGPEPITASNVHLVTRKLAPSYRHRVLQEIDRPYRCEGCGNEGVWQGRALKLHIDHVDGDVTNNYPDNYRYLCPNCHSQTPTFGFSGRRHSDESKKKISARVSRPRKQRPRRVDERC